MAKKKVVDTEDHSTEEKIIKAARKVFTRKGYAAARTRDIAEEAGINLALLNYYFRSKEKLFDMVMKENMLQMVMAMKTVLNDESLTLEGKVAAIADNYISLLSANPDLPLFVLSEIRSSPDKFASNMGIKEVLRNSHFFKQVKEHGKSKVHPMHFFMNMMGMMVFPFIAAPLLKNVGDLDQASFNKLMDERRKLIPTWIKAIMKTM